jgi:hypothetical protein
MAEINQIKLKQGLEVNRSTTTPISGEPIWTTDTKKLYIGDGSTEGGIPVGGLGFKTVAVSGQSDVVANSTESTLTLVAGANVSITTNATTDEITIAVTGSGTMSSWTIAGDTGTEAISNADTLTISGDAGAITTTYNTGTNVLDINHNTSAGYSHIPSGGATNQVLVYGGVSGTATWSDPPTSSTYDRASLALTGADVFSDFTIVDGLVTATSTRTLTLDDISVNAVEANVDETITGNTTGWTFTTNPLNIGTGSSLNLIDNVNIEFGAGTDALTYYSTASAALITKLAVASTNLLVTNSTDATLFSIAEATGQVTVSNDLVVSGNLTVGGTTTTLNTTELLIEDNIITLNSTYTGSTPTANAGIEIERGTLTNATLQWNEASDYWEIDKADGVFYEIITSNNVLSSHDHNYTLQQVTDDGATTTNAITITNTTEASSSSTGALILSGGIGIAKSIYGSGASTSSISGFLIDGGTF